MATKDNTLIFEVLDSKDCGFIMDGTEGTPHEQRLVGSDYFTIPNVGKAARKGADGKIEYVDIRYIAGDSSIYVEDQEKRKVQYNPKDPANKPIFRKNLMTCPDEPGMRALREFMSVNFLNVDAPHRPDTATAIYKVVKLENKIEKMFSEDEAVYTEAVYIASKLRKKDGNGSFTYEVEKIDNYIRMFQLRGGDSPAEKFFNVLEFAKRAPEKFVSAITIIDNTVQKEVEQAYDLKVISFDDNVATFTGSSNIIKPLGTDKISHKQKIEIVSDFLKTPEGEKFLVEMRNKVEETRNKKLSNK